MSACNQQRIASNIICTYTSHSLLCCRRCFSSYCLCSSSAAAPPPPAPVTNMNVSCHGCAGKAIILTDHLQTPWLQQPQWQFMSCREFRHYCGR